MPLGDDVVSVLRGFSVALCLAAGIAFAAYSIVPRLQFARAVAIGMSKEQVVQAVGRPDLELAAGEYLAEKWGNVSAHDVTEDTWIYHVAPKSQHRFRIMFSDEKVTAVEHDQN